MPKPKLSKLVAEIAAEMKRREMTAYALAKAANIPAATLGRILDGSRPDPRLSSLERLAKALEMKLALVHDK